MGSQDVHREVPAVSVADKPTDIEKWVQKVIKLTDELKEMNLPQRHRREFILIMAAARTLNDKVDEIDRDCARHTHGLGAVS